MEKLYKVVISIDDGYQEVLQDFLITTNKQEAERVADRYRNAYIEEIDEMKQQGVVRDTVVFEWNSCVNRVSEIRTYFNQWCACTSKEWEFYIKNGLLCISYPSLRNYDCGKVRYFIRDIIYEYITDKHIFESGNEKQIELLGHVVKNRLKERFGGDF